MTNYDGPLTKVEVLDNIFIVDKGIIKILLLKNESEPYKGYWCLPRKILGTNENVLELSENIAHEYVGTSNIIFDIGSVFSNINRISQERVLAVSTVGFTDSVTLSLNRPETNYEYTWFDINSLPKMIYDHSDIATKSINDLKNILNYFEMMKRLFPSDFTLSELQKVYEQIVGTSLDRRNFRKKILALDILEETGDNNIIGSGRPAKLYRFKDDLENKHLF
jgi:8-oxo-dGTP diphosphatase